MWSSTLPTGTIRTERRAGRTFPRSDSYPRPADPTTSAGCSQAAPHAETERLRAENRQLEAHIESLRSQVERHQADTQAIVDRYERVIAELEQATEAEIQRLQSEVDRLQTRVDQRQQSQQGIIDRYEAVIAELETAAATAPPAPASASGSPRRAGERARSGSLANRLTGWLFG